MRIVLAYVADPSPDTDLTDPADTRDLVRTFVLPGVLALRGTLDQDVPSTPSIQSTATPTAIASSPTTKGAVQ